MFCTISSYLFSHVIYRTLHTSGSLTKVVNKMEQSQAHHKPLGCLLLWMLLCHLVTTVQSDRVMWVDTKGKDDPQCIHKTPVGALMAQPPPSRSCKSLRYALQNSLDSTSIRVTCGTHDHFKTSDMALPTSTLNVTVVGECTKDRPTVRCMNGSSIAFHGITSVVVRELVIETCGKQGDLHMCENNPTTLYISNCTNVKIYTEHNNSHSSPSWKRHFIETYSHKWQDHSVQCFCTAYWNLWDWNSLQYSKTCSIKHRLPQHEHESHSCCQY